MRTLSSIRILAECETKDILVLEEVTQYRQSIICAKVQQEPLLIIGVSVSVSFNTMVSRCGLVAYVSLEIADHYDGV